MPDTLTLLFPRRAPVLPRVRSAPDAETLPLQHHVERLLNCSAKGPINLFGPAGAGKTTALSHLAALFPDRLLLLDDTHAGARLACDPARLTIYATPTRCPSAQFALELTAWSHDDLIEYLLHTHPQKCKPILQRLGTTLTGSPALCSTILEEFAADDALTAIPQALRLFLRRRLTDAEWTRTSRLCLECLWHGGVSKRLAEFFPHPLLTQPLAQIALASSTLAADIATGKFASLHRPLPQDLISQTASILNTTARAKLADAMTSTAAQPMAASLLFALDPNWCPKSKSPLNLKGLHASSAQWPGINLTGCNITLANLNGANLADAILSKALADGINLSHAKLPRAKLDRTFLDEANLPCADLTSASGASTSFESANLQHADLRDSCFVSSIFSSANLTGARFTRAILSNSYFNNANLQDADFTQADLSRTEFREVNLTVACFHKATFHSARLHKCDLEQMRLIEAEFQNADLTNSYLTASFMPRANFRNASLRRTGLADVDWQYADLRDADLTHASFHMGSSRSGLVGSTLASEGTRTGFYTDDYSDQDFKSPEEIRKANLIGADLRGAKIENTDFYLVDLRRAKYTPAQARHLTACGAILHDRP